jgi:uncharacterized protein YecE (DUF72 family)
MQNSLFSDSNARSPASKVAAASPDPELIELSAALPANLYLGTSSWSYPGWAGIVWDRDYSESTLSRYGLSAYSQHPLFRTVSIDRSFYRPLSAAQFAVYAAQVPNEFRFVVKAPSLVTDALRRDESGKGMQINPNFLDAEIALREFIEPALMGLGSKLGALVFQISPLPFAWLTQMPRLIARLHDLLRTIPDVRAIAPDAAIAIEVRDAQWLTSAFISVLRDTGATYCMGLHAKMPRIAEQLPILRALWPGPLVCRWNLNPLHGAYGYEDAAQQYEPYDRIHDADIETRSALARVIAGTVSAGQNAFVTLSNKAEGSAPLSVVALAEAVCELQR